MPFNEGDDEGVISDPTEPAILPGEFDSTSAEPLSEDLLRQLDEIAAMEPDPASDLAATPEGYSEEPEPGALEFDDKHRQPLEGLLYLGALRKQFSWGGHTFNIRTLRTEELLTVSQIVTRNEGMGADRAYITATAAASIEMIDGRQFVKPMGPDDNLVELKYRQALKWFSWTADAVYEEYRALEAQVEDIISRLGESSG